MCRGGGWIWSWLWAREISPLSLPLPTCYPITMPNTDHLKDAISAAAADLHLSPRRWTPILTPWQTDEQDNRIANRFND